jgi:outer membrane protein OmpA-like peptidoglycan-associated protein
MGGDTRRFRAAVTLPILFALTVLLIPANPMHAQQYLRGQFRIGLEGGFNAVGDEYTHNYGDYSFRPSAILSLEYYPFYFVGVSLSAYGGEFANSKTNLKALRGENQLPFDAASYTTRFAGGAAGVSYIAPPFLGVSPSVFLRGGLMYHHTDADLGSNHVVIPWTPVFTYGFGAALEYPFSRDVSMRISYGAFLTNSDELDAFRSGSQNDGISALTVGFYYTFNALTNPPERGWFGIGTAPATGGEAVADVPPRSDANAGSLARSGANQAPLFGGAKLGDDAAAASHTGVQTRDVERTSGSSGTPVDLRVKVDDFASLDDLRKDPDRVRVTVHNPHSTPMPMDLAFQLRQGDSVLAEGTRQVVARPDSTVFNATDLLGTTRGAPGNDPDPYQTGEYAFDVSAQPNSGTGAQHGTTYDHLNYSQLFGENAPRIRTLVDQDSMSFSLFNGRDIQFSSIPQLRLPSPVDVPGTASGHGAGQPVPDAAPSEPITRDAVSLVPSNVNSSDGPHYIADMVRSSFTRAELIDQSLVRPFSTDRPITVKVANVYFPFDDARLTDESKIVLDNLAAKLVEHPEYVVEVRGFADDIGDDGYNMSLSEHRAERVAQYLRNKGFSSRRVRAVGFGRLTALHLGDEDPRSRNRTVSIVLEISG